MPIRSVDDIRKAWGDQWASASDEELLDAYSKAAKLPIGQVADALNWGGEGRGMWGNRGSAAVDSYQANLYGIGEALGSDWARRKRIENDVRANVARDWARQQGAISSYKDVGGLGDFGNYAGGLAIDSAPYLGEVVLGGITGGATLPGTVARMGLGTLSRGVARTAGAVGASYPSSVGDILANQREQTGTTNLGSALLGGIPYAAANAFGVTGALARGAAMKSGIRALDELTGLRGVAARTGASVGKGVLTEAPAETFQEGVNQYFGRMAVDPNETFFNERSNDRFMESAVGGGVLGGLFGGGMGGWRRSNEWYEKQGEEERRAEADALLEKARQERLDRVLQNVKPPSASLIDIINGGIAPDPLDDKARAAREKEYADLLAVPSGRYVSDTATGQERQLTIGEMLDMEDRARNQRDYTRESGTPLLGYDPRVVNPMPSQFNVLPNGQAVDPATFNSFPPIVQSALLSQGVFSPISGLNAANAISQPAGPFTPERVDMLLGLPVPLTEEQRKQKQRELGATLGQSSGVRVQDRETGQERELSMSEFQALQAGQLRLPVGFNIYLPDGPAPGEGVFTPPNVVNVNPFGQAGGSEEQNQTLLANVDDPATELMRQRIAQGFTGAPWPPAKGSSKSTTAAPAAPWANQAEWDKLGLPKKRSDVATTVFDQAVEARKNGDLDDAGYFAVAADLKGGKTNSAKLTLPRELNRVAGQKALPAAPTQPATPNVVINAAGPANQGVVTRSAAPDTKPSAPAAPINEPTNQLLQGTPDVSVAAVAGERTGGSSVGQRADTGTGVADAGRNTAAAVGSAEAPGRVESVGSQAGTVSDAPASGAAAPVSEAAPDVVVGTGNPDVAVTTKKTRKAALGTDERRADILARIQEAKASGSKLSGVKGKQGGGIDVELLALYAELAADHVVKTGRNFAEFTRRMVSDLGEDVKPYLRQLHTEAQAVIRKDVKAVAVERTPDGAPVMLESKNANGEVVGYTVKLKGKAGAYIRRDAESGQLVLVPERSGLTKQDAPVYLGDTLEEALDELPVAYGLLKTGRKIKEASGKTAVEFAPKNKAVVGGSIDFDLLHKATEGKPQYLKSIYLYLGIDKDGTRLTGKPMSANAAAREGGWGKNSGQNLTKAMNALGISDEVQTRFMQSDQLAPPLPGEALPMSVRERLNAAVEQDEESLGPYVNDLADTRNEDERGVEEAARGAGAFDDEANIDNEDSNDGSVLERFNEGISTISSAGGSSVGTEKTLNTSISSVKRFKALAEAIKRKLPLDSFPTVELLAGFHKVTKHVLPDILEGSESQTVIDNAYANEEFMLGLVEELKAREKRAEGSPTAKKELVNAGAAIVRELEKEGTLIRDDKKGRSKTAAERDEEFVAGLARDDKGNFDEANSTQADADQASAAESLFDSGRQEDEEADRVVEEQLGDASTANSRRGNEDQVSGGTRFGKNKTGFNPDGTAKKPYTVAALIKELSDFMRTGSLGRNVVVVDSVEDLLNSKDPDQRQVGRAIKDQGAFGVATNGKAYLVANRINQGSGRAKFMHEVGSHLGIENLLPKETFDRLFDKIREWARKEDGSQESELALAATQRAIDANTPAAEARAEVVAYFIEEAVDAGIDPTAGAKLRGPMAEWFRTLWAAFKTAVRKIRGVNVDKLTPQDVVNLAYGAARLEVNGTWHGTAAMFRRFNHAFMGSGEGAQAYGWGTYLAQKVGIAKGYWRADVGRKTSPGKFEATYKGVAVGRHDRELNSVLVPLVTAFRNFGDINKAFAAVSADIQRDIAKKERYVESAKRHNHRGLPDLIDSLEGYRRDLTVLQSLDLSKLKIVEEPSVTPDGSLMRVDTAVDERDMLDWDKPLSAQSSVMDKIAMYLPENVREAVEEEVNLSIDEMTGKDLYEALQFLEGREGVVSDLFDADYYNKELANAGPKKVVSYYMDQQLGVQGIKFLDADSRDGDKLRVGGQTYTRSDLVKLKSDVNGLGPYSATLRHVLRHGLTSVMADLREKVAKTEAMFYDNAKTSAEKYKVPFDEKAARTRAATDAAKTYQGEQLAYLKANAADIEVVGDRDKTRNLVIFNDKNIFRVGAEVGADRQRMRFGTNDNARGRWMAAAQAVDDATARANRTQQEADEEKAKADRVLAKRGKTDTWENLTEQTEYLQQKADEAKAALQRAEQELAAAEQEYDPDTQRMRFGTNSAAMSTEAEARAWLNALPPSARNAQNDIVTVVRNAIMGTRNKLQFTHDLIDRATKLGLESAAKFGKLYRERAAMMNGLNGRVDDVARLYGSVPEKERGTGEGSANMLLKDSTMSDKWAFEPSWLPKGTATVDPQMKARFDALSPESQTYIKAVFEHGHKTLVDKKRIILNATATEYDALIASAKAANGAAEVAELEKKKAATITKYDSLFKTKGNTPYAPLKRFGDWVVVAESKALKAARAANDEKLIAQLEQDGEHYYVDFFESNLEALRAERKLRESGLYDTGDEGVVTRKKSEERQRLFGGEGVAAAFTKLRTQVKKRADGSGDVARKALLEMATDMYLSALAETSARKSEMRRKGVAGDIDMLRSFTSQGYADAHMMSALAFSGVQGDEINAMEKEARKGGSAAQTAKTQVFNELVARHVGSMEYVPPNWLDQAKTAASIYYLAVSPAYYLQNLTQPWMVSLPVMAGRHGFSKSASMLWKAGSELADAWVGGGMGRALDLNKVPADLRSMLKIMMDRGVLTSGQNREFENIKAAGQGRLMNAWTNSRDFIDGMQMKAEAMNRASTAAAAYRMELAKGTPEDKALEYVDRILRETHGDYSNLAAPRIFSSNFGKLALQFRKYQLLQLSLMGRLVRDIYQGNERAAAMRSLGFVLAQAGVMAGGMGLPGFTAIAWLLTKMFGDPDEPDDPEYKLRKLIGDKDTADLILKGLPARMGVNLSNKIGWQNMLSILPYTDIDFTKKSVTEIGFALPFGAAGAMTAKVVDGIGAMRDGRYVEGLAKVMPKGFGDGVKAIDTAANGVRNKQGEVLLTPDEINFAEAAFMGIGLTPTEISSQQFRQGANIDFNKKLADRATKIKQQYVDAVRDGESTADARKAWDKLQESRVENGFKKQPLQDLLKAVAESRKQERETMNGVQYRNTNRQFVENLGSI